MRFSNCISFIVALHMKKSASHKYSLVFYFSFILYFQAMQILRAQKKNQAFWKNYDHRHSYHGTFNGTIHLNLKWRMQIKCTFLLPVTRNAFQFAPVHSWQLIMRWEYERLKRCAFFMRLKKLNGSNDGVFRHLDNKCSSLISISHFVLCWFFFFN